MKTLKQNIRKTLKETSENKKQKLIENAMISSRFKMIIESTKNKKKIFSSLTEEMNDMVYAGFEKKQISEALSNIFSSVFGPKSNDMFVAWRDHGVNWLLSKLELDQDVETADYIRKEFEKVPANSIPELFADCNKVTELVINGLVEGFQNKIRVNSEGASLAVKFLMDGVYNTTKDENFQNIIESKLKDTLCPLLSKINSNMQKQEKDIKSKILSQNSEMNDTSGLAI